MLSDPAVQICRVADQLSVELDGEIAILNLKSKKYFGLTDVGAFIWERLETPTDLGTLAQAVAAEFDVDLTSCANDIERFLNALAQARLLHIE